MVKSDSKTVNSEKPSQASGKKVDDGKLKALGLAMRLTRATPSVWASTRKICWCHSQTMVSRHWKLQKR